MYKENPVFQQPPNENEKVWRYMDFTKFVSILESKSLYFSRTDEFDDPFEGSYPLINVSDRPFNTDGLPEEHWDQFRELHMKSLSDRNRNWLKYIAINCWHLNNHESAAMWRLYLKSNEGIAIQTTYQKLRDSFSSVEEDIFLGQVRYIDYETEGFEGGNNVFAPFVHKRRSFEHEREVRAVVTRWPIGNENGFDFSQETITHGLHISVDLSVLIERIYIAPDAPPWFAELVNSIVKRYGDSYEVIQSNLNQQPLY